MHAKALVAAIALAIPAFGLSAMAQTSGPAKGVTESTSSSAGAIPTQGGPSVRPVVTARDFVEQAASSGMFEVEAGQLAAGKANREAVRAFGQRMVSDHTAANQKLMALAGQHGVVPPSALEPHHTTMLSNLQPLSGSTFDSQYMQSQVLAHQEAVALFESATQATGSDMQDFRSFAAQMLPVMREHLQEAQSIAGTGTMPTAKQ